MDKYKLVVEGELSGKTVLELGNEIKLDFIPMAYLINNLIVHHSEKVKEGDIVTFYSKNSKPGYHVYVKTLLFLVSYGAMKIFPDRKMVISNTVSKNIYCFFDDGNGISEFDLKRLKEEICCVIDADKEIVVDFVDRKEGLKYFKEHNMKKYKYGDKFPEKIPMCSIDGYRDYYYSPLAAKTGFIKNFDLKLFMPGFLIRTPNRVKGLELFPFVESPKYFDIIDETEKWNKILGLEYVSNLNLMISEGGGKDLVLLSEAYQEKKISQIANHITEKRDKIAFVLIAGPSSSGKTTFASKLRIALMANGLKPISLGLDDFFRNREDTPIGDNGKPDFDAVNSLDLTLFNKTLGDLVCGKEVSLPTFNFITGKKEWIGKKAVMPTSSPVIIEGLHALNPLLTQVIPRHRKYLVNVSSLTQLNIDEHNYIRTTDARLLRRMVRDMRTRGRSPIETLESWPGVRRGEEEYIFPFQENADVYFNSHLPYELCVLKKMAIKELEGIKRDSKLYSQARHLIIILRYFEELDDEWIPPFSIIREMIGQRGEDKC